MALSSDWSVDLQWEPFKFKMDSFLLAVSHTRLAKQMSGSSLCVANV